MKKFKLLTIPALVLGVFAANAFYSKQMLYVHPDTINDYNHRFKVKARISMTTQIKDESTEADLRGLLKNRQSLPQGG